MLFGHVEDSLRNVTKVLSYEVKLGVVLSIVGLISNKDLNVVAISDDNGMAIKDPLFSGSFFLNGGSLDAATADT